MKHFRYSAWAIAIALLVTVASLSASASLRYFDTDQLQESGFHTVTLRFAKDSNYMIVAAASQGSVDFDLTVIGPDGEKIISSDSTDENTDWVRFKAPVDGDYKIKITAYKGNGWYELMVLNTDGY